MNITINGDIYITNYGQPINDIVGDNEDLDLPFDFFDDEEDDNYCNICNDNCEDCELYEGDDEDEEEDRSVGEIVDELTSIFADILSEEICCPQCIKEILIDYTRDLIDSL